MVSYYKLSNDYKISVEKLYIKYKIDSRVAAVSINMEKDFIPTKTYSKSEKSRIQSESISV